MNTLHHTALALALFGNLATAALAAGTPRGLDIGGAAGASVELPACSASDLGGVSVSGCVGFSQGNLLQGDTGAVVSSSVASALLQLGLTSTQAANATYLEKIGSLLGGSQVDFNTPLAGATIIGLHLGGGSKLFGGTTPGGGTAFYRFDAGSQLDSFSLGSLLTASSGAAVFRTSPVTAVPEPQSYALMLTGLVAIGFVARRRA